VILLATSFASTQVPIIAYAGLIAAGLHMANQIRVLDIDDADQCLALFKSNTVVGWLIFGDFPDRLTWIGTAIIVASGIYVFHREAKVQAPTKIGPAP